MLHDPARRAGASEPCDACLRRGFLVGRLATRMADLLERRSGRVAEVLALADADLIASVAGADANAVRSYVEDFDVDAARDCLQAGGVRALCRHQPAYPPQLAVLADAPAVLFVKGAADLSTLLGDDIVTVVGTRRPSPYGRTMARELGRGLAAADLRVVSGLAIGIDAEAHRGCLERAGTPIAVLACGPDVVYPRTNCAVYERILEHGLVVSELPPGWRPFRWAFPARNRIMAGLAAMTVVVEAAQPSGSLITSTFASQCGRAVGAVPGLVTSRLAAGTNGLLADGARLVTGAVDIVEELFGVDAGARMAAAPGDSATERSQVGLEPVARRLLDAVEAGHDIDAICLEAGLPAREVRAGLARLEASGHVCRDGLGSYHRAATTSTPALGRIQP